MEQCGLSDMPEYEAVKNYAIAFRNIQNAPKDPAKLEEIGQIIFKMTHDIGEVIKERDGSYLPLPKSIWIDNTLRYPKP